MAGIHRSVSGTPSCTAPSGHYRIAVGSLSDRRQIQESNHIRLRHASMGMGRPV